MFISFCEDTPEFMPFIVIYVLINVPVDTLYVLNIDEEKDLTAIVKLADMLPSAFDVVPTL